MLVQDFAAHMNRRTSRRCMKRINKTVLHSMPEQNIQTHLLALVGQPPVLVHPHGGQPLAVVSHPRLGHFAPVVAPVLQADSDGKRM